MRKAIIAGLAIAFLTSPLHAESAGSAALRGAAKGGTKGAGGEAGGQGGQKDPVQKFQQQMDQMTQARKNPPPTTGPKGAGSMGSGSSQTKGRK